MSKVIKSTKYKGVYHLHNGMAMKSYEGYWVATKMHKGKKYNKTFKTEREAALAYDKWCLEFGLPAENILIPKP